MKNALTWFEIPVTDLDRAVRYYEGVFEASLQVEQFNGTPMALFPHDAKGGGVGGALVVREQRKPAPQGSLVYLNATGKLDACIERASSNGGEVLVPKTDIGDPGFIALIKDPDGNTVGLHSPR